MLECKAWSVNELLQKHKEKWAGSQCCERTTVHVCHGCHLQSFLPHSFPLNSD